MGPRSTDSSNAGRGPSSVATRGWAAAGCRSAPHRVTLSYVKGIITIRLEEDLERELDRACKQTGRSRSDLVRDALRRQLALLRFRRLRAKVMPLAEARGYVTDEDVFRGVS